MLFDIVKAMVLGVVEGLTEFVPVSSTGHLLLVEHFFGFGDETFGKSFAILIQFGAVLALLSIYFLRLWKVAIALPYDPTARRFVLSVLIAFLPAMVIGVLFYRVIKEVLFNPWIVCTMFIVGGFVLLWVDRLALKPRYHDAMTFSLPASLGIGFCQCLAMIPGVSRSGATIVAAMLFGAVVYELYKNWAQMGHSNWLIVAVGFVVSFIAGWWVVKRLLDYVSQHTFSLFVWWRVVIGAIGLIGLALFG